MFDERNARSGRDLTGKRMTKQDRYGIRILVGTRTEYRSRFAGTAPLVTELNVRKATLAINLTLPRPHTQPRRLISRQLPEPAQFKPTFGVETGFSTPPLALSLLSPGFERAPWCWNEVFGVAEKTRDGGRFHTRCESPGW